MKLENIIKHPAVVFVSLLDMLISVGTAFYDLLTKQTPLKITLNMNYFEITIRLLATVFLFLLWRSFLRTKDDVQKHLNDMNENWYNQLSSVSQEI